MLPWVERYRPRHLSDLVGQEDAQAALQSCVDSSELPHLIVHGPPGSGKTSSLLCLARHVLGDEYRDAVLLLNASIDRRLSDVRDRVRHFARARSEVAESRGAKKLCILDEVDSMTVPAQEALRRVMEDNQHMVRFALACNDVTRIIEPLQSRCLVFPFHRLRDDAVLARLAHIVAAESVPFTRRGMEALVFSTNGDLRHGINILQGVATTYGRVTEAHVLAVAGLPPPRVLADVLEQCLCSQLAGALSVLHALHRRDGYSVADIVQTLQHIVLNDVSLQADMYAHSSAAVSDAANVDRAVLMHQYLDILGDAHLACQRQAENALTLGGLVARLCRASLPSSSPSTSL